MSSAVYYRFKSQKEPSRVLFDGTGITIFDLKREIIINNKLGDGTGFDLSLYDPDTNEEYTDDTVVLPRASSVIVRRLPASRPGRGNAARYLTGKLPIMTRDSRHTAGSGTQHSSAAAAAASQVGASGSEADNIKAMFSAQDESWKETQQHMASIVPVRRPKSGPTEAPPPNYVCYKCGQKGHFIQDCPSNDDPNFDGKRIKRTTGIPRTFLKTVEKTDEDNDNVMVTEDGKLVVAVADDRSWETYKKKTIELAKEEKVDDPTLVCPLTKKLFEKPVKTPCCSTTYSDDAIQQALLDSDFVCPKCGATEILLDQLKPDEEMEERVKEYKQKKKAASSGGSGGSGAAVGTAGTAEENGKRKRDGESVGDENGDPESPSEKKLKAEESNGTPQSSTKMSPAQLAQPLAQSVAQPSSSGTLPTSAPYTMPDGTQMTPEMLQQMMTMSMMYGMPMPMMGMGMMPGMPGVPGMPGMPGMPEVPPTGPAGSGSYKSGTYPSYGAAGAYNTTYPDYGSAGGNSGSTKARGDREGNRRGA